MHNPPFLSPFDPVPLETLCSFQNEEKQNSYQLHVQFPEEQRLSLPCCEAPSRYHQLQRLIRPFTIAYDQDSPAPLVSLPVVEEKEGLAVRNATVVAARLSRKQTPRRKPRLGVRYGAELFLADGELRNPAYRRKRGTLQRSSLGVFCPQSGATTFTRHTLLVYLRSCLSHAPEDPEEDPIADDSPEKMRVIGDPIVDDTPSTTGELTDEELVRLVEDEERRERLSLFRFIEEGDRDLDAFDDLLEMDSKRVRIDREGTSRRAAWNLDDPQPNRGFVQISNQLPANPIGVTEAPVSVRLQMSLYL